MFWSFGKFQHNLEISVRMTRVSRLSFRFLWLWFNNRCNKVKWRHWKWIIYTLCNFLLRNDVTCFQKKPPLFLEVKQIPQENAYFGVFFKKNCRSLDLLHACFSLYLIIHVINLIFNDIICTYIYVSFYTISFIDNRIIALDIKIDKIKTWLNLAHKNLLFGDMPKGCNFI